MKHAADELPEPGLRRLLERVKADHNQDQVDELNRGFRMADQDTLTEDQLSGFSRFERAGYLARKGVVDPGRRQDRRTGSLIAKIKAIWAKWDEMSGDNRPLVRCKAGPRRDFDINIDGMAHYGLLPDLLQDMRNTGLSAEDLAPLFRSAYDYVEMWAKCAKRGTEIVGSGEKAGP